MRPMSFGVCVWNLVVKKALTRYIFCALQSGPLLPNNRVSGRGLACLTDGQDIGRDLPSTLRRCLGTTNIIESPNAGIRQRTGRVTRWRRPVIRGAAGLSFPRRSRTRWTRCHNLFPGTYL